MKHILLTTLLLSFFVGCGNPNTNDDQTNAAGVIPSSFFASTRPVDVVDLVTVKETARTGDKVTFLARIGGRKNASFISSLAMMIVADPGLVSCELMSDDVDHCETPEDYCCENPATLTKSLGTIRFLDDQGEMFPFSVEGSGGMEILKYVVVTGKVHDINEKGVFIVDASKIWVGGKPNYGNERQGSGE